MARREAEKRMSDGRRGDECLTVGLGENLAGGGFDFTQRVVDFGAGELVDGAGDERVEPERVQAVEGAAGRAVCRQDAGAPSR